MTRQEVLNLKPGTICKLEKQFSPGYTVWMYLSICEVYNRGIFDNYPGEYLKYVLQLVLYDSTGYYKPGTIRDTASIDSSWINHSTIIAE